MPDKEKKPEFVVTDRRLFSNEGELRQDVVEDEERRAERERETREAQERANEERAAHKHDGEASVAEPTSPAPQEQDFDAPTPQEQQASVDAYRQSTQDIDARIEKELRQQGQGRTAKDFEMTFEKFVVSIYMTALMQLGLAAPQGAKPEVDLIGARQTIDTLSLLQDKTKGNLSAAEEKMLQNCLYELRMAYLEVTNMITRPPQGSDGKA